MIRVIVIDDHPIVREGIKHILHDTGAVRVVAEAGTADEALRAVRETACDVTVLDLELPGADGIELLKQIRTERPLMPVLVMSAHSEDQYAVRALRAGAAGYLTKDCSPSSLVEALRRVIRGGKYISARLAEILAFRLDSVSDQPHQQLSNREYHVFTMIASGKTVGQIAQNLSLSVKTISTYRSRILEKFDMSNNTELTRYAIKSGLVE